MDEREVEQIKKDLEKVDALKEALGMEKEKENVQVSVQVQQSRDTKVYAIWQANEVYLKAILQAREIKEKAYQEANEAFSKTISNNVMKRGVMKIVNLSGYKLVMVIKDGVINILDAGDKTKPVLLEQGKVVEIDGKPTSHI